MAVARTAAKYIAAAHRHTEHISFRMTDGVDRSVVLIVYAESDACILPCGRRRERDMPFSVAW
ncbi:MAG: hypothetical protein IJ191_03930 [Treponema sp.]|nr:hypothetical protein [Treponema sp.]